MTFIASAGWAFAHCAASVIAPAAGGSIAADHSLKNTTIRCGGGPVVVQAATSSSNRQANRRIAGSFYTGKDLPAEWCTMRQQRLGGIAGQSDEARPGRCPGTRQGALPPWTPHQRRGL